MTELENTKLPFLQGILSTRRLQPGSAEPRGIYCFRPDLTKAFSSYAAAEEIVPGVYARIAVRVLALGQWPGQAPKVIRKDQWLTTEAVVQEVVCEIFAGDVLDKQQDWVSDLSTLSAHWALFR